MKNYAGTPLTWQHYKKARKALLNEYRHRNAGVPRECKHAVYESHSQTAQLEQMNSHLNWLDQRTKA